MPSGKTHLAVGARAGANPVLRTFKHQNNNMALNYEPRLGTILMCDFSSGFRPPEMIKKRLCIVVSRRMPSRGRLSTVVPLSTTPPNPVCPYHHRLTTTAMPPGHEAPEIWAKCDMIFAASWDRLELVKSDRDKATGKRTYWNQRASDADIRDIKRCILYTLALESLNNHVM